MIATPFGKKEGFWWAMIVQPAHLVDGTVLEREDYMVPNAAGAPGAMMGASNDQIKAYKSDMEG